MNVTSAARQSALATFISLSLWSAPSLSHAQTNCAPLPVWQRSYGGTRADNISRIKSTADGGFLLAATSSSLPSGTKTATNHGITDIWLTKIDQTGTVLWEKSYGGSRTDTLHDVIESTDGGFILVATSRSGISGNKSSPSHGESDAWIVSIDAAGEKRWERSFGGTHDDSLVAIQRVADGGYVLAGSSFSQPGGTKVSTNYGERDMWVVRIDPTGQQLWDESYGSEEFDGATSLLVLTNGNILLGGISDFGSNGTKTAASYGSADYWLVMIDGGGAQLWDRSYGGLDSEDAVQLAAAPNNEIYVAGVSHSYASGNKQSEAIGGSDLWFLRLNEAGDQIQDFTWGGLRDDFLTSLAVMPDGGLLLTSASSSAIGFTKTSRNYGATDAWLLRLGPAGEISWDQSLGGSDSDGNPSSTLIGRQGQIIVATASYSRPSGNKTAERYDDSDLWIVELAPETDCDLDGVANESDFCNGTPGGTLINTNGCTIEQLCPCDGIYESKDAYVGCVSNSVTLFVAEGLITPEEGTNLIATAASSACPIIPESQIFFGLTNALRGDARFGDASRPFTGPAQLIIPNHSGTDGVTIYLGQAESGIFIRPDAPIWGSYDEAWLLTEEVYGSRDGIPNAHLATISGRKPNYEVYPVMIDFSPLGAESLTFEVYNGANLESTLTTAGSTGTIVINTAAYVGPRVNPLWRWKDGSMGALIEFLGENPGGSTTFEVIGHGHLNVGRQIFVRVNNPTSRVDYVSRVDISASGGFFEFSLLDEHLGIFGRPHKGLGVVSLQAELTKLTARNLHDETNQPYGLLAQLRTETQFDAFLQPLALMNSNSSLSLLLNGDVGTETEATFGLVKVGNVNGTLELLADFSIYFGGSGTPTEPATGYELKVYQHGKLSGGVVASNGAPAGTITSLSSNGPPKLVAVGGRMHSTNNQPEFALTFDRSVTFTDLLGNALTGNQFRFNTVAPLLGVTGISAVVILADGVESFTVVAEQTGKTPSLSITRREPDIILTWEIGNQPYRLEVSPDVSGPYEAVTADLTLVDNIYHVTLPIVPDANRFFRLHNVAE